MPDVESVNPEPKPIIDNEATGKPWVDPIYLEKNPERLPDEPEPTPEQIAAQEAEKAEAAEAERKANGTPTKAELKALIEDLPDDEPEKPEEGAKAKEPDGEAEEVKDGEQPDKDAEEAEKKTGDKPGEDEEGEDAEEAKEKKPRRRSKGRRERRAMERRVVEQDAEIARLKEQAPEPKAEEAKPQPKLEDFEFDTDKWAAAMGEWTTKQIDAGKEQAAKAEEAKKQESEQKAHRERFEAFDERAEDMRDLHDDYDEVTRNKDLRITDAMSLVIQESELGPQIAYHLGKNPEESERIAGLSPLAQAKALGRIETRLEAEEAKAETPNPDQEAEEAEDAEKAKPNSPPAAKAARPKPTQAPAPISTVGGGGSPARRDPKNMSMDEFVEGRRSGKIK